MRHVLLLLLAACSGTAAATATQAPPPTPVQVAVVASREISSADELTGHVEAKQRVDLRPRVAGYITAIRYKEGSEVASGAPLFSIDARPYQAVLARAQADLARAQAKVELARVELARTEKLVAGNAVPKAEHDTSAANARAAEADVAAARATVEIARLDVEFTQVRAPFAGRSGQAMVTVGDYVAPASVLTSLASIDPVYVYFTGDEKTYLRFGAKAQAAPIAVGLADEVGYPHAGTLDFVDNRLDPATATMRFRATFANTDKRLIPGLYTRVHLVEGAPTQAIAIDDKAVMTDQDRRYAFVVTAGKIERRDLTLGPIIDGRRLVTKGLAPGDQLVIGNMQKVYPGAAVQVVP